MKKPLSGVAIGVIIALAILALAGGLLYLLNRDTMPITGIGSDANTMAGRHKGGQPTAGRKQEAEGK